VSFKLADLSSPLSMTHLCERLVHPVCEEGGVVPTEPVGQREGTGAGGRLVWQSRRIQHLQIQGEGPWLLGGVSCGRCREDADTRTYMFRGPHQWFHRFPVDFNLEDYSALVV
jgi:hypothetical protein